MDVKIFRNFLSQDECKSLSDLALENVNEWFGHGITYGGKEVANRLTSRMYIKKQHPQEILEISDRVRHCAGVSSFPLILDHGKDGIVISITKQGGDVYQHRDPRSSEGLPAYRCNILTQVNEDGAELYVNDKKIDVGVGDLHCYMVSELPHYVTEAKGKTPRIMYMFGAYIPKEYWSKYGLSKLNS